MLPTPHRLLSRTAPAHTRPRLCLQLARGVSEDEVERALEDLLPAANKESSSAASKDKIVAQAKLLCGW